MSGYPANIGPNSYALLLGLAESLAVEDAQLQQVLGAMRLQSSIGGSIDSWAFDVFGTQFYRFAQFSETDAQWISRIESILTTQKCTVAGLQSIINVFWPWILLQMGFTPGGISGSGLAIGEDTFGGEDTGQQFIDAPGTLSIAPVPIVFDQQSNPTFSGYITPQIVPPYFCVYLQLVGYSDTLIAPIASPSPILTQLVNAWKATGTVPIYATN